MKSSEFFEVIVEGIKLGIIFSLAYMCIDYLLK